MHVPAETISARVVHIDQCDAQPWRNGAGVTRRIAIGADRSDRPAWTLSLADIETDSDFSTFPGLDRTAVVVGDDPISIAVNGSVRTIGLLDRIVFAGEDEVRALPTRGPSRLLNLMTRRDTHTGSITLHHLRGTRELSNADGVAWMVLAGSLATGTHTLRRWDTVILEENPITLAGAATVAAVVVTPAAPTETTIAIKENRS